MSKVNDNTIWQAVRDAAAKIGTARPDQPRLVEIARYSGLPEREYQQQRRALVEQLLRASPGALLHYSEEPEEELRAGVVPVAPGTWRIQGPVEINALDEWLYLGNWVLYEARGAVISPEEWIRLMKETDYAEMLRRCVFFLCAFHDNEPWLLGISSDC
jgi:hypothetical protein